MAEAELPLQPHVVPPYLRQQHQPRPQPERLLPELPLPVHPPDVEPQVAVVVDEVVDVAGKPLLPQLLLHSTRNWTHFWPTADTVCIH